MRFTDEQYKEVGEAIADAGFGTLAQGRAAVAAVAPLLLGDTMTGEVRMEWEREWAKDEHRHNNFPGDKGFRTMGRVLANRLASLTAKPDPAVEAVKALMVKWPYGPETGGTLALEIVAAVDAARAK